MVNGVLDKDEARRNHEYVRKHLLPSMWLSLLDANHYAQPRTSWS